MLIGALILLARFVYTVDRSAALSPSRSRTASKPTNPGYVDGVFVADRGHVAPPSPSARGKTTPKRYGGPATWWEREELSWWERDESAVSKRPFRLTGRLQA